MKKRMLLGLAVLSGIVMTICGCAGTVKDMPLQPASPGGGSAVLTLSSQGSLPSGSFIGGIDVTLNLPPGVTVKADKTSETLPGVVVSSGGAQDATIVAKFTPAAAGAPGKVRIALLKLAGFGTGEFATLHLDIDGPPPLATDFSTEKMTITDVNGKQLNGLSAKPDLQAR
jgi:hypothetical protein